jgi:hypothetical protein
MQIASFLHTIIQCVHKRLVQFQKLTRNLFLTLHGHNAHRQNRQLSQVSHVLLAFASHAYCGAAGPVSKMASQQKKAFCVLRFEVSRSVITVQREFCVRNVCYRPVSRRILISKAWVISQSNLVFICLCHTTSQSPNHLSSTEWTQAP